ncbi:efflux RND transporter periplasmic adaptor subunit [Tropicimonas sp. IMCC6043]|uniref:efflux RND transporter periplasmic adaptor subunit n=1 Tax=Tropicimonas sp. IMCC6043 TaxID=2510645 RepID=UPI00101C1F30|nr:efflux RND transporter periplasmic adaptor subunit [Tropicimonas sp. IMCC6043]RYH08535.1 efflux RND transporter periplasmic adaptor subunit [Tropicimonas sp. IMCC6043]
MIARLLILLALLALPGLALAQDAPVARNMDVTAWKAVFGRIEARDRVPARSRLGGTLVEIAVSEGSRVTPGEVIARVVDEKLNLQLGAIDAQLSSLTAQLENAEAELARGENLLQRGVTTAQRLDALRTQVDVIRGQIGAQEAQRAVLEQQEAEGAVLAPIEGTVLSVPVTQGSVVLPGETIAEIGGGGFYLRLAVPERHATKLEEGAQILIEGPGGEMQGQLAKIYPLIENGRVLADVDVEGLSTDFVDARVLVRLPVASEPAVVVPATAVETRMGLDFVTIAGPDGTPIARSVVPGEPFEQEGETLVRILSGLEGGETLVTDHD